MSSLPLQFLLLTIGGWMTRDHQKVVAYLLAENEVLREQLRGRRIRFSDVVELIIRIAHENPTWGYTRIRGALSNLGHELGRNTIKRILIEAGIDPAPKRGKTLSWSAFLRAHWGAIAAMDSFSVEVLTLVGLVRYHVLVVIDLASRRVEVAGIVREPYDAWMRQIARNLTDAVDGFLIGHRYLIMDRAPVFTAGLRALLAGASVESVRLPARSPNLNAYAERFVRSIRDECLSNVVPLGERHLRELVQEFVAHYHRERNHQGLGNELIERSIDVAAATGPTRRRKRLGGMLNFYYRAAA